MPKIVGTKPKRLLLAVAVLAGVATPAILPAAATAAVFPRATSAPAAAAFPDSGGGDGCNPGRPDNSTTYYWIGGTSQNTKIINGTPIGGVYANIRTYSPFVAGPNQGAPSGDSVSEWVMLDAGTPGSSDQWAQIGWLEFPGGVRNTFIQTADGSNNIHTDYYSPSPINSTQTYGVLYQPGAQDPFVIAENGVNLVEVHLSWAPDSADINAELHTEASQVPGGTADPSGQVAQVTNAHVWPTAGSGSWGNFDGYTLYASLPTTAPEYFIGIAPFGTTGNNSWRTWDKACTK
jgi:hypothetical protein